VATYLASVRPRRPGARAIVRTPSLARWSVLALVLLTLPGLVCVSAAASGGGPIRVCASIPPQAYLVERVGGDAVDVAILIQPGQSPHSFEPSPSLVGQCSDSDIVFSMGLPFEEQVASDLMAANPDLPVVDSCAGLVWRGALEGHAHDESAETRGQAEAEQADAHGKTRSAHAEAHGHEEGGHEPDPHVWLSPTAAIHIAVNIKDGLSRVDPLHSEQYEANLAALTEELTALDAEISEMLAGFRGESFFVFHPAYGYFADEYGLDQVAIEVDGREPGPRDLAAVVSKAKALGVTTIFVQPQHAASVAETAAAEIGARVVSLDPLAHDYVAMMRTIAREIAASLSVREKHDTGHGAGDD